MGEEFGVQIAKRLVLCHLQVLVIYLGDMRWKWLPLAGLLPFQKHRQQKVAEADSLVTAKRLTKPILFHKALKVIACFCELKLRYFCSYTGCKEEK